MTKPITISLSPNTQKDDVLLAARQIIDPGGWSDPVKSLELEKEFAGRFGKNYQSFAMTSGRGALFLILRSLGIGQGDEVLVQSFTCSAAVNPIIWNRSKPVYVDIDRTYNLDVEDALKKINKNTKAIIVQHTFGIPAEIEKIARIAKEKDLYLIEDCAVSLGAKQNNKQIGTFGDVAFFSFGRDKIISSVWGGMILVKKGALAAKIKKEHRQLSYPAGFWIFQQLLHPLAFSLILPSYNWGFGKITIGKAILVLLQRLSLLSVPVSPTEKSAKRPSYIPAKMPGALAALALNQFRKLDKYNRERTTIARIYQDQLTDKVVKPDWQIGAVWLRYPIQVDDAMSLLKFAHDRGILLGDWYRQPVYPVNDLSLVDYHQDCNNVEKLNNKVVNLPTYPTMNKTQAYKVMALIEKWMGSR